MEKIAIELPYLEIATSVFPEEGISKSFLTPFGIIEIMIKEQPLGTGRKEALVAGDIDSWIASIGIRKEFQNALVAFLRQIIAKHFLLTEPLLCHNAYCRILPNGESGTGRIQVVFLS